MEHSSLSLQELNALVRKSVRACLPGPYWVQAELSEVRANYSGHCYLEFVQKDPHSNALLAKARGIVWGNVYARIRPFFEKETGQAFGPGIKVLVQVTPDFHELYGYSLTVTDIDPAYTLGDMARRRREILRRLEEEGVLTLNKELEMPEFVQRIAVISSETAAGYGDFCNQLLHNPFGFQFYVRLFPAVMQGDRVETSVISALDAVNAQLDCWDVVVIIRGGGAVSDLAGFDTYHLAANCAQFPLPVITGIGHERDDTVLDLVAHTRVKTPTAAAEYLIARQQQAARHLEDCADSLVREVPLLLEKQKELLDKWLVRIPTKVLMNLKNASAFLDKLQSKLYGNCRALIIREEYRLRVHARLSAALAVCMQREVHRLALMEQQVKAASPQHLLERGYSLTLKDGKAVTDASMLRPGDELTTRVAKGEFKSKVL